MNKKAILLLSGGIDSPVAAHMMQKRGYELVAVHFYNRHAGDINTVDKCVALCKMLGIKKMYLVAFDQQQAEVVRKCTHKYYYIITRRLMWMIAEELAKNENAEALVTGENLAQVASQTLTNMTTIQKVVKMPILRPIMCNDKVETIKYAREIGTYEVSKGPEVCCLFGPKHPATRSTPEIIELEERKIDVGKIVGDSLKNVEVKEI